MSRILIADDDSVNRLVCRHILQTAGHDVILTADGLEAWHVLQQEPVDLLLSDIAMPQMDGYALLRKVRADDQLNGLPVIMLTALGDDEATLAGAAAAANLILTKPVSSWQLSDSVRQLCGET